MPRRFICPLIATQNLFEKYNDMHIPDPPDILPTVRRDRYYTADRIEKNSRLFQCRTMIVVKLFNRS